MNAMTDTDTDVEAVALSSGTLEVAELRKNLLLVPFSRLRLGKRNVRRRTTPVHGLAASILRMGLLQNLLVVPAADGWHYDVEAGGRRYAAIALLVKKRKLPSNWEVPCLPVADASATTMSLMENVQREAMHPADQFEAFAALVAEGRPIEDIAADFQVSPLVVRRRLRLANISPRLMAAYREDSVTLEQLMALAISDDHAAQDAAFFDAPQGQRQPYLLRNRLTDRDTPADHPMVRLVTIAAYQAAGGTVRRDLFADDDRGIYLADSGLLEHLARQQLAPVAERLRAEGWGWVEVSPRMAPVDLYEFQRAPQVRLAPGKRDAARVQRLRDELATISQAMVNSKEPGEVDGLARRQARLVHQMDDVEKRLLGYSPEIKACAGAVVMIDRQGKAVSCRGLLRPADAAALRKRRQAQDETQTGGSAGVDTRPAGISDRLARQLSAHRTAALQIETARHPHVALAALVHGMAQTVLHDRVHGHDLPLDVRLDRHDRLEAAAPDWPESPAAVALRDLREAWAAKLPTDGDELLAALLAMGQDDLLALLAVCVAPTVNVLTLRATLDQPGTGMAKAVGLDMAQWWAPTAASYFQHVPKTAILAAVREFSPSDLNRLSKLKKADIASEAERLAAGTGWMPPVFTAVPRREVAGSSETVDNRDDGDRRGDEESFEGAGEMAEEAEALHA